MVEPESNSPMVSTFWLPKMSEIGRNGNNPVLPLARLVSVYGILNDSSIRWRLGLVQEPGKYVGCLVSVERRPDWVGLVGR